MGKRTPLVYAFTVILSTACSSGGSDGTLGQTHSSNSGGASGRDAGQGGTDSGGSLGRGAGGSSKGGVTGSGGTSGGAGAPGGGASGVANGGTSGASNGGAAGLPAAGGNSGSANGGQAGTPGSGGAVVTDAASPLCGTEPCHATRCAAWNCGAAECCTMQTGPVCVHFAPACPSSDSGEEIGLLQCWSDQKNAYLFEKTCTQKSDCFVAEYYRGCCNVHAVGLNVAEQSRFTSFEQDCGAPPCGCCCDHVTAEDGKMPASGATPTVDCVAGTCKTLVP